MPGVNELPTANEETQQAIKNENGEREDELVLGTANNPLLKGTQHIRLPYDNIRKHLLINGVEGVGRSDMIINILTQLAHDGHGFCYIDHKSSNALDLLKRLPEDRLSDVELIGDISPVGEEHIQPVNMLEIHPSNTTVSPEIIANIVLSLSTGGLSTSNQSGYWGTQMDKIAKVIGTEAVKRDKTILDLREMFELSPDEMITEPGDLTRKYLNTDTGEVNAPFIRRLNDMASIPVCNDIFDSDGVSIYESMRDGRIVICSLSSLYTDPETKPHRMVANGLITKFYKSIQALAEESELPEKTYPIALELDNEVPKDIIGELLAKGRSYGTPVIGLLQWVKQLNRHDREQIFSNTSTVISFDPGDPQNANQMVPILDLDSREELLTLKGYTAIMSTQIDMTPVQEKFQTLQPIPPRRDTDDIMNQFINESK